MPFTRVRTRGHILPARFLSYNAQSICCCHGAAYLQPTYVCSLIGFLNWKKISIYAKRLLIVRFEKAHSSTSCSRQRTWAETDGSIVDRRRRGRKQQIVFDQNLCYVQHVLYCKLLVKWLTKVYNMTKWFFQTALKYCEFQEFRNLRLKIKRILIDNDV